MTPKLIYMYGLPRGGTNLFSALFHNHPQTCTFAHGVGKGLLRDGLDAINRFRNGSPAFADQISIYPLADIAKDYGQVRFAMFDKVHWRPTIGLEMVETSDRARRDFGDLGVSLLRNPLATLSSRAKSDTKWERADWRLTPENVDNFIKNEFAPCLARAREESVFTLASESLGADPQGVFQSLMKWLDLPYDDDLLSLHATFKKTGSCHGVPFEVRETDIYMSSHMAKLGAKIPARPHFFCPACDQPVVGYGTFNPYDAIDFGRLAAVNTALDDDERAMVRRIMEQHLGQDIARFFEDNDDWRHECLAPIVASYEPPRNSTSLWYRLTKPLRRTRS